MVVASELVGAVEGRPERAAVVESAAELARGWLDELFPERRGEWRVRACDSDGAAKVADSPGRLVAVDGRGVPRAMVFVSSERSPGLVERGAERAAGARLMLGDEAGAGVLVAMRHGWVEGVSIAMYPWRLEIGGRWLLSRVRRPLVREWVLGWLRGVVRACGARLDGEASDGVGESLRRLAGVAGLSSDMVVDVERSLERLELGSWRPRRVLDHNDLWPGNVMLNRDHRSRSLGPSRYAVIDWAGANPRGFGFFDLVRASRGFGASSGRLGAEVGFHAATLGIERPDALSQLLASMAWLHDHIEDFPIERFVSMATDVHGTMRAALLRA